MDKIEKLQKQDDVEAEELEHIMPENLKNFNFDPIKKCYTDNKEPIPFPILMIEAAKDGGLPPGMKPRLTRSQLQSFHDYLSDEIKEHHCGCDA